ncbi:MAG: hypothetical protein ACRD9W_19450 [Terriglobia bacterium]
MRALTAFLVVLGICFLGATTKLLLEYIRFRRLRRGALLTWAMPKPANHVVMLGLGVALGLLVVYKLFFSHQQAFGETMMFLYYVCVLPLSWRIQRGFYEDGIWADGSFIPYNEVGGITWREGEHQVTLIVISRLRNLARRLHVPGDKYGAARRILRDKIGEHTIQFAGTGLDLSGHDERDDA